MTHMRGPQLVDERNELERGWRHILFDDNTIPRRDNFPAQKLALDINAKTSTVFKIKFYIFLRRFRFQAIPFLKTLSEESINFQACRKMSILGVPKVDFLFKVDEKSIFEAKKSIKETQF